MDDYPDLSHLVDVERLPAADTLQEIVRRHHRRRSRTLAAGLAVVAVAGPILGFAVARSTDRQPSRVVAAGQPSAAATTAAATAAAAALAQAQATATGMVMSSGGGLIDKTGTSPGAFTLPSATRIFLRTTADGIRIRAYTMDFKIPAPAGLPAACFPKPSLMGEVSDDLAVGQMPGFAFGDLLTPNPVNVLSATIVGVLEQSPMWTATLRTASNVARVVAHFRDGTSDDMAPQQGWAILAHHAALSALSQIKAGGAPPNFGSVEAFDSTGRSLGSASLSLTGAGPMPPARCLPRAPSSSTKPLGDEMKPVTTIK